MALATAPERQKPARGWRGWRGPTERRPFPSLGWLWLDWTYAFLPSPADERDPLVLTDEQARRIVRWGELDPVTGEFAHLLAIHEEAKGWGKSPLGAILDAIELAGPACFDGWDSAGEPVGVPWGTGERPAPWIQIAAISEDQTENTYGALFALLAANNARAADVLRIDLGRTRLYLRDRPGRLEPVTASAGSREGQRLTKFTADEGQLWTPQRGGPALFRTLRRNVAKMDGRGVITANAAVLGEHSIIEQFDPTMPEPGVLHHATRPREVPSPEWTDEQLVDGLRHVYLECRWINPERLVRDIRNPATPWQDTLRYFFNLRTESTATRWMPASLWDATKGDVGLDVGRPVYAAAIVAEDNRSAAIAVAQKHGDAVRARVTHFPVDTALPVGDYLTIAELEAHLEELRRDYPAKVASVRDGRPIAVPGPEISYTGALLEGTAQRLGSGMIDDPVGTRSPTRLAKAAGTTRALASQGLLLHEPDPELARQIGDIVEQPFADGMTVRAKIGTRAPGAYALIVAVHRASTAQVLTPRKILSIRR